VAAPSEEEQPRKGVAQYAGFSLHAGTSVEAEQTAKLERLVRYVSRPAIAARGTPMPRPSGAYRNTSR
jgi:hypothetical protein